jgi:hypothetical protein
MRSHFLRWRPEDAAFASSDSVSAAAFVLYLGPNDTIEDRRFQDGLRAMCPDARLLGCTTGTIISGAELLDEAALAVAVELDSTRVKLVSSTIARESSLSAGAALAQELNAPDLAGVLVLCDSLNVDGVELVRGLRSALPAGVPISGGLASDGSAFARTIVGADCAPREKLVAALGFYGAKMHMTQGCAHGWDVFGPPRRITKAAGSELFELDGEPALDLYERYLGEDAADLPASALRFPLLVANPDNANEEIVRTVLNVDRVARSLTFASAIQEGWSARLMRGAFDHLTDGARRAADQAAAGTRDLEGGLALLVSCVGRRIVMGLETEDEVEATDAVLAPRFQQIGFYSHGEISTISDDGLCGLHNQTMTIVAIQEAA